MRRGAGLPLDAEALRSCRGWNQLLRMSARRRWGAGDTSKATEGKMERKQESNIFGWLYAWLIDQMHNTYTHTHLLSSTCLTRVICAGQVLHLLTALLGSHPALGNVLSLLTQLFHHLIPSQRVLRTFQSNSLAEQGISLCVSTWFITDVL